MRQPVTELDTRFSDQNAVATDWEETRRMLEDAELFWITTVRVDGRPHVTPLVAVWLDEAIHFATGAGEQKAVNLRTNQNVILTTGCNDWEQGLDVVVEGEAVQVIDESVLEQLAEAWAAKWDGRWHYEVHHRSFRPEGGSDAVLVFAVKPVKVLAFAKGTFGQTRHRFSVPARRP
jgi:nitroimidazol reductase NimA-like FMN-containing flavoprotein (pyridoxamine 5'-phosphate oxidase superfamily)